MIEDNRQIFFFLSLGPKSDQVQNFEVTMRTATEVHLSWDPPAKIGVAYYMVRRNIAFKSSGNIPGFCTIFFIIKNYCFILYET